MKRILFNLLISAVLVLPMLTLGNRPYFLSLAFVEQLERAVFDFKMQDDASAPPGMDRSISIVDIDQQSIDAIGAWPWRRDVIAKMIHNLHEKYRAKLIVLSDPISYRDRHSARILDDLRASFSYDEEVLNAIDKIEPQYDFDMRLLREMDGSPLLLVYKFEKSALQTGELPEPLLLMDGRTGSQMSRTVLREAGVRWPSYPGYTGNSDEFMAKAADSGFVASLLDSDGKVRRMSMLGKFAGEPYLSLVLQAVRHLSNPRFPESIWASQDGGLTGLDVAAVGAVRIGELRAGIAIDGTMLLNFRSPGGPAMSQFPYVSAAHVVGGDLSAAESEAIKDKIVFVGSSSLAVNDLWGTPVNSRMPGVELYASALSNIISGEVLHNPKDAWIIEGVVLVLLAILLSLAYPVLSPLLSLVITVAGVLAIYRLHALLWTDYLLVYRMVPFIILMVTMFLASNLVGFLIEWNSKRHVQRVLGQYLPPSVAKQLGEKKAGFSMDGEIREMTIMFSDVRGFTSFSEGLKPHELTRLMNRMLTALSHQIHAHNGTIDKYIGDAVMAFWNAPFDDPDHAANAVRGAFGMLRAMEKLSAKMEQAGHPRMRIGLGINTGESCVGNMGSDIRLAYTVMGDSVNLASRLESLTKQYDLNIIVGERTKELSDSVFLYRPVDAVRVKGRTAAVAIYEPLVELALANMQHYQLRDFTERMWDAYRLRRFKELRQVLLEARAVFPQDGLFRTYAVRTEKLLQSSPPEEWEPVTSFEGK